MNSIPASRATAVRLHLPPLLLWTMLWAIFWLPVLRDSAHFPPSDLTGQFDAYARFQAEQMLAGRLPLWTDGSFGGLPFVADPQAAVFYLPRWLTILLSAPFGYSFYALELEALLHLWLAGTATYFLAYDIGRSRWGGGLAAVAFGLGGYLTSYPLLQLAILETAAWLPLALLCLRKGILGPRSPDWRWLCGSGLVLALAASAGHPQTLLHVSYLCAAYYLFLARGARWSWAVSLGRGVAIAAIAVGGSAVYWLPVLAYFPTSVRAESSYAFVSTGQRLLTYLQGWMPGVYTFWSPEYVSLPALMLIAIAWFGRRFLPPADPLGREIRFWGIALLLIGWLSLGDEGILWQAWYRIAPGFQLFRQQERLVGVMAMCAGLLVSCGAGLLLRLPPVQRQRVVWRAAAFNGGLLLLIPLVLLATRNLVGEPWLALWLRQAIIFGFCVLLLWLAVSPATPRWFNLQRVLLILMVLAARDLALTLGDSHQLRQGSARAFWPQPVWLDEVRDDPNAGRFDPGFLYFANVGEAYGLETVRGITPLKPQLLADMESLPLDRLWPLLHVTHGIFQGDPPAELALTPLATADPSLIPGEERPGTLYRFEAAQPRAWLSDRVRVAADSEAALGLLLEPGRDLQREVVLLEETAALFNLPAAEGGLPLPEIVAVRPGFVQLAVTSPQPAMLVVSNWALPGWEATVNGRSAPIYPANYGLQGIFLEAGTHTVLLRFNPPVVWLGLGITLLTLLLTGGGLMWRRRRGI